MKNILLSVLMIVFLAYTGNAQVCLGIEAGGNMSTIQFSDNLGSTPVSWTYGGRGGVLLDVQTGKNLAIEMGLNYSMMGYQMNNNQTIGTTSFNEKDKIELDYVQLPLNVLFMKDKGRGKFFISVGPYLGVGVKGKLTATGSSTTNGVVTKINENQGLSFGSDSTSDFRAIDFGASIGVGYRLPAGLFVRASYDQGMTNLSTHIGAGTNLNSCLHVSIGYLFPPLHRKRSNFSSPRRTKFRPPYNHLVFPV